MHPDVNIEDGPAGVGDGLGGVTQMPSGLVSAATFDPDYEQQSANAGLTAELPGGYYCAGYLVQAVQNGQVARSTVDTMVSRALTQMFGMFDKAPTGSGAQTIGGGSGTVTSAGTYTPILGIQQRLEDTDVQVSTTTAATRPPRPTWPARRRWRWSLRDLVASYDGPDTMIDAEEPRVRAILATLPVGAAPDAACGTGRHAAHLVELGHHVIGADASAAMVAQA